MGMNPLVIYHGGCTDGVAAAWVAWKAMPRADFYAGEYQTPPPLDIAANASGVWVLDFSWKAPEMRMLADACPGPVTVLDHHKTARDELVPLLEDGTLKGEFDMERCGAVMAWDYLIGNPFYPPLLRHIDARDRWIDERPEGNDQIIMALRSYPHAPGEGGYPALFRQWDGMMSDPDRLRAEGEGIWRYYRQRVDETKAHAALRELDGVMAPMVNAPFFLASEVAGELAQDAEAGWAAAWWENADGSRTYSLRSRGEVDVSEIAKRHGGGGHAGAAGFKELTHG